MGMQMEAGRPRQEPEVGMPGGSCRDAPQRPRRWHVTSLPPLASHLRFHLDKVYSGIFSTL